MLLNTVACWLSLSSLAFVGAVPPNAYRLPPSRVVQERQASTSTSVPDGQCTNGPLTRNCWSNGFSISTDFDAKAPPAGKTVTVSQLLHAILAWLTRSKYNLEITNTTLNPDGGGVRPVMVSIFQHFPEVTTHNLEVD